MPADETLSTNIIWDDSSDLLLLFELTCKKIKVIYIKTKFQCAVERKINKHDGTHEMSDRILWISFYYASSIKITFDGDKERRVFEKVMCGYLEQDSIPKSSFDPFANPQDSMTLISIFHLLIFDIQSLSQFIRSLYFTFLSLLKRKEKPIIQSEWLAV